jgi:transposase InsO family protein
VEEKKGTYTRYTIDDKLLHYRTDETEPWRLCLPDTEFRKTVIHENHDLPIAGHPGFVQTYSKIARSYYWPGMHKDIRKHTKECDACQRTKASTQPPIGELQPMPIPHRPWQSIGMDFLMPVPESKNGHNAILVIVDRLTKMAHFIPTTDKVTAKETAELFLQNIFRYHGLPDSIVSDRDPRFTSHFWENLHKILGIKLLMSTAEHPQTDGQSEATVKIVQKLIRPFAFQEQDWEMLLPSLEFAYNDTQQSTTGETPFYLNYGHHPKGTYRHADTKNPHAEDHVQYLIRLQEVARDAINDAQTVQARYANKHRTEAPPMKPGDWVLLRRKKADKTKFAPIADGPFQILKVGTNNVELKLPKNSTAHPTVNISRVQLYFGPRPEIFTEPPKNDAEHDYPVDRVMGHKVINGVDHYYIHWKGYPAEDDSWEPAENLAPETLKTWHDTKKTRQVTRNSQQ